MATNTRKTMDACPECGLARLYERSSQRPKFMCANCYHEFDEPDEIDQTFGNSMRWECPLCGETLSSQRRADHLRGHA